MNGGSLMKNYKLITLGMSLLLTLAITPVQAAQKQPLTYSNLVDQATQKKVANLMIKNGLTKKNVNRFFQDVNTYNKAIKYTSLVKKGYKTAVPAYDSVKQQTLYEKQSGAFIGNNCRISAYTLMKDQLHIKGTMTDRYQTLFMDQSSLANNPHPYLTKHEQKNFMTYYAATSTKLSKDVNFQRKRYQQSMKQRGITYKKCKATLISVVMHSYFSAKEDYLFVGHTGVLLQDGKGYLFIEKLSFEDPYQAIKLRSIKQLKAYLMTTYDVDRNQPTAKPFIMENNHAL
jgi:hypothetical protein